MLPGVSGTAGDDLEPRDVADLVSAFADDYETVVVEAEIGDHARLGPALFRRAGTVIGVGAADPSGVARLLTWRARVTELSVGAPVWLAVNRAPRDRYRRAQLVTELGPDERVTFLPDDDRVTSSAWNGTLVPLGPFVVAVRALVDRAVAAPPTRRRRRSHRGGRR